MYRNRIFEGSSFIALLSSMTPQDEAILAQQSMETLAEWWCQLNSWDWPEELPDPEPREYVRGGRRGEIMQWIDDGVGRRVISRTWNKSMTDEEHNDFWRGHFEGHKPSKDRDRKRKMDKIKSGQPMSR